MTGQWHSVIHTCCESGIRWILISLERKKYGVGGYAALRQFNDETVLSFALYLTDSVTRCSWVDMNCALFGHAGNQCVKNSEPNILNFGDVENSSVKRQSTIIVLEMVSDNSAMF